VEAATAYIKAPNWLSTHVSIALTSKPPMPAPDAEHYCVRRAGTRRRDMLSERNVWSASVGGDILPLLKALCSTSTANTSATRRGTEVMHHGVLILVRFVIHVSALPHSSNIRATAVEKATLATTGVK